jgi:heme/copper-type cytochrome/quinol oxidase subunit 3
VSSAAAPLERRAARPNGWWGMVVFVATEATLFGTMIGSYYFLRFHAVHWPPAGVPKPHLTLPLVLTAVLVSTSLPVALALSFARRGLAARSCAALFVALVVQTGYLAMQIHLYVHDLHLFSPQSAGAYGSIYFTLLGAHHAHVALAILLEAWFVLRLASGVTRYRLVGLQAVAFYVNFVNVLALVVVAVQLSAAA